jgi:hypothetical protein
MKKELIYIVLLLLNLSCQKLLFNDNEGTREITLDDFHAVYITGIYDLILIQDSTDKLVISGSKDINSITAEVISDTLFINDHKKMAVNPNKNTLVLHFSSLDHLTTYDPVSVSNTDTIRSENFIYEGIGEIAEASLLIDCNYFLAVNSANTLGYFHISGFATTAVFFNRYGGSMFAENLKCKDAEAINGSVGDIYVNASDNITASIRGPGNIYYRGKPLIRISEKTGTGNIVPLD